MSAIFVSAGALALLAASQPGSDKPPERADLSLSSTAQQAAPQPVALAPATAPQDDWTIVWKWKEGMRFETANGQVKGRMLGRIQWDASWLDLDDSLQTAGFTDADGTEFRRARLGVYFELFDGYEIMAEYDFVAQDVQIKDLYFGKKDLLGPVDLRIGHYKEPFSIGQLTSDSYITFVERALPDAFVPARNSGVQLSSSHAGDAINWAIGGFKDTDDGGINQEDGGYAVTGRVSGSPIYNDEGGTVVHVGASYTQRDDSDLRYRQRPELHLSDFLVDTGTLDTDDVGVANLELASALGPVHGTAEYMTASAGGNDDIDVDGFYVEAGWFITGEHRPYRRSAGVWDRLIPIENAGGGGTGAWEVAARFSTIDLTDGAVVGGEEDNITVAVNWYLNPNMRWGVDYIMGNVDLGPGLDDEDLSALVTRIEANW